MDALLLAMGLQVLTGTLAALTSKWPRLATVLGAGGTAAACVLGLVPTWRVLLSGATQALRLPWDSTHGDFCVELDALSAFFLVPILGLSALGAVYGSHYLLAFRKEHPLGHAWFFYALFVAGMVLVVLARTAFLFLAAWEIMSIAAFFLVTFEHNKAEVRNAGWVYLIATHLGVALLLLAFLLLGSCAGSLEFEAMRRGPAPSPGWAGLIFLLALGGFGAKAGIVPFHVWLPEAHPAAPSHVSALMSGVMIKMGLYGLLRVVLLLGPPAPWWGTTLAGLGLLTGLIGITLALHQRDVKRVLAYSSIENMGLIVLAFGIGLWGWSNGLSQIAVLGMTAGLLHIWNHALMKGLLFFAAGSVLHATSSQDMERLGGVLKRMPWTGSLLILGAVAIAALPPLNGFVSKWLLYVGLFQSSLVVPDSGSLPALLAFGLLALIGGLAVVAFVRLTGIVLLGTPRSEAAQQAQESSPWLLGPMLILSLLCLLAAVVPQEMNALLGQPLTQILGPLAASPWEEVETEAAPLFQLGNVHAWIMVALGVGALGVLILTRRAVRTEGPTWGCGYVKPTPRMQYTGRSFAEMLAEHLVPRLLRPRTTRRAPDGLFPTEAQFASVSPDPLGDRFYEPFFRCCAKWFTRLRVLQQGHVHVYLIYLVLMVILTLAWAAVRRAWNPE